MASTVFGWPAVATSTALMAAGLTRREGGWCVASAVVLSPFAFYLGGQPLTPWGYLLPALPLIGAATARRRPQVGWLCLGAIVLVAIWLAWRVFASPVG